MKRMLCIAGTFALALIGAAAEEKAATQAAPLPAAILPFAERGSSVKGYGEKVSELLFAALSQQPDLWLVDRQDIEKVLVEHELSASGMVDPAQAVKLGSMTGAKVMITGSVLEVDNDVRLIAKIIGTETTRVLGVSVGGTARSDLGPLVTELSGKVAELLKQKSGQLIAPVEKREDRIAALKQVLGDKKRPVVSVRVAERHVGQATIDPAAQTELMLFCQEAGFTVAEDGGTVQADVQLAGEGFSEFGLRRGNLVSVKARVEVKAVDRKTGEVLAADRETGVEVDLTEQLAGKKALQSAAARIAERLLPKLAK
jgi:curli biogenesis system outer membrane secretion channel CsgG